MRYRLISLDLDGTLLGKDKSVSDRNAEVLARAVSRGIRVVITTGRILAEARRFTERLGMISAIASSNGAYIVGSEGGKVFEKPIGRKAFEDITRMLDESGLFYCAYGPDAIYVPRKVLPKLEDVLPAGEGIFCRVELVDDIRQDPRCVDVPFYKINVYDRRTEKIRALQDRFATREDVEFASSAPFNIEMTARGVDKGTALRVFGRLWGIRPGEMAAFGDGENDIPMFRHAGMSFAMGNAPRVVKKAASRVTGTNLEDGVADAIEKCLLEFGSPEADGCDGFAVQK